MSDAGPQKLSSGHTVEKFSDADNARIQKHFPLYGNLVRLQPGNWFYEECAPHVIERIYNMKFRSTDVITMTFPKSGTTWSQEILWTFLHNPNLDHPKASLTTDFRAPHLEADIFVEIAKMPPLQMRGMFEDLVRKVNPERANDKDILFTFCDTLAENPRILKTHLNFSLMNPKLLDTCKVFYIARDPRDIIVSRYSYLQLMKMHDLKASFDEYLNLFLAEELWYSPYFKHLEEAWNFRNHPNMLFIYYEDMKSQPEVEFKKINKFLGTNLSEEQVQKITDYTSFKNMKKRTEAGELGQPMSDKGSYHNTIIKEKTGGFFRKGTVGDWKDSFTEAQVEKINQWIKKNTSHLPKEFPYRC